jgi:hypothetical membrane protein
LSVRHSLPAAESRVLNESDIALRTFARTRRAVVAAIALAVGAMLRYPGGTPHDRASSGYSLSQNFLSDLGMTVAYDGRRNVVGAALFVLSLLLLVVGLGGCLLAFVRLYARSPRARRWARAAGVVGMLAAAAFVGVAVTPENAVMDVHVAFTVWAWRIVPFAALLLCVASAVSDVFPPRVAVAWGSLAALIAAYVALGAWGPSLATDGGLRVQVVAQKTITAVVIAFLLYLSVEAERATLSMRGDA